MADDRLTNTDYVWNQLDYEHDVLIEASAGTGKTYALESIVLKLVCDKGYDAKNILLVTFTEKAAGELKDRVRRALAAKGCLPPDFDEMTICTIHSFCQRLLSVYAFENGVPMRCEVGGASKSLAHKAVLEALRGEPFCKEYGDRLYEVLKDIKIKSVAALVETEQTMTDSADFGKICEKIEATLAARKTKKGTKQIRRQEFSLKLAKLARPIFEDMKRQSALLTFDDMVARAAEVVTREPQSEEERKAKSVFFKSIRERYRVALVDEFQDTDKKQWDIFRTLFSCRENKIEGGKPGFLLVVGDPKQAIYSFRGADVKVYCEARESMTERKTLDETYRSKKTLIDVFNAFFGSAKADGADEEDVHWSGWFKDGAGGEGIIYEDVCYPRRGNGKFDGIIEEREPAPVLLLESMPARVFPTASSGGVRFGNKSVCLPVFMDNAAKEMRYLNGLVPAYTMKDARPEDPQPRFRYGDMCVLVEGRNDAAVVRKVLAGHGIPYGQYKQQGLYDSAEAEGVLALLDYLANPGGRGNRQALLLSPVFGVHPSELGKRTPEEERVFDAFVERLQEHARKKAWDELFECVMSDRCTALTNPQGDVSAFNRTRAAMRQMFDALLMERGRLAETPADFALVLRAWRKDDRAAVGEDRSLYNKESAADRVQIMTMHASKGLQFPIVFLAYGFSRQVKRETSDEEKSAALQERRRLLYVALTRAEHRLYLPWSKRAWKWTAVKRKKDGLEEMVAGAGIGSAGAALHSGSDDGFLGKAIQSYFKGEHDVAFAPERTLEGDGNEAGMRVPRDCAHVRSMVPSGENRIDVPGLNSRRVQWNSFSTLQKHGAVAATEREIVVDDAPSRESEPWNRVTMEASLLPRNNVSGNVFHEIMEALCENDAAVGEVDFTTACDDGMENDDSRLMDLIRQTMRRNLLGNQEKDGDSTEKTLLRMVQHVLNTRIVVGSTEFKLKDVPKRDRLAEVEFVASENCLLNLSQKRKDALNGKIDLLVRRGERVFVIDWKTNSLVNYTSLDVIGAAMNEAGYHLQYRLYSLATAAWIRNCGLTLAGAIYLFVRGGEVGLESGVFVKEYEAASMSQFRDDVLSMGVFATRKEVE